MPFVCVCGGLAVGGSGNDIGADGIAAIADALTSNTTITSLELAGEMWVLERAVVGLFGLAMACATDNGIDAPGAAVLANALNLNSTISSVDLCSVIAAAAEGARDGGACVRFNMYGVLAANSEIRCRGRDGNRGGAEVEHDDRGHNSLTCLDIQSGLRILVCSAGGGMPFMLATRGRRHRTLIQAPH